MSTSFKIIAPPLEKLNRISETPISGNTVRLDTQTPQFISNDSQVFFNQLVGNSTFASLVDSAVITGLIGFYVVLFSCHADVDSNIYRKTILKKNGSEVLCITQETAETCTNITQMFYCEPDDMFTVFVEVFGTTCTLTNQSLSIFRII